METLDFSVENAVGWIRLTRPEIHNPLDVPLRTDLMTVLEQVRNDPAVRVLVLNGGAGAFCAGGNLHRSMRMQGPPTGNGGSTPVFASPTIC